MISKMTKGSAVHPIIQHGLSKLGKDMALARRARKLSTVDMAERMGVDRGTLRRLEKGDPGVSLNTLAMALHALGMLDRIIDLADRASDDIGLMAAHGALPKRIVRPRPAEETKPLGSLPDAAGSNDPEGW
ncbi:helix-turn-helix domain-containing protein [Citreicella sp. C3M06]|uniref:helix-turn-helix transcriptional regulator n=1 Tax=Citreicella sp. C3M06 TaxID=2841564 RepID=UPI001C0A33B2|nr:helix-turn-helix transcriptional regulator [Citreicella sp. C3M06]MBU2961891.1 helix-turn-helix domain-containing protein [Citreicella sp. C3M06]